MTALVIDKAGKDYDGHPVLDGVSFTLPEGLCVALIGHNGAGKTTLMKLVLGLIRPTRGRIEVLGADPATANKGFRRQLGFLPENVAFHDEISGAGALGPRQANGLPVYRRRSSGTCCRPVARATSRSRLPLCHQNPVNHIRTVSHLVGHPCGAKSASAIAPAFAYGA